MNFCCRFYYFYLECFFFYIFFRGFLFYQLGPGPTEPSDAETKGFIKISLLHFTFEHFYLGVSNVLKRFLGSLLVSHALVFLWSVLGIVAFVIDLRLVRRHAVLGFADCAGLCPSGHQHQTHGTGPDDPAPGSKDLNSASFMMLEQTTKAFSYRKCRGCQISII